MNKYALLHYSYYFETISESVVNFLSVYFTTNSLSNKKGKLRKPKLLHAMDHFPIRQTSELGKFISTAGKSIINVVKL